MGRLGPSAIALVAHLSRASLLSCSALAFSCSLSATSLATSPLSPATSDLTADSCSERLATSTCERRRHCSPSSCDAECLTSAVSALWICVSSCPWQQDS